MENENFLSRITYIGDPEIEKEIKSGDPYTICDLLEETKGGIYLRNLENAIVAIDDIVQIYEFLFLAVDMKIAGFNQERFERLIQESKNPKLMCYSMAFVPGTNIEAMLSALEETQNAKYMEVPKDNEEYHDVYEQVKQIDPEYEEKIEVAKEFDFYPESLKEFRDLKDNIPELKTQIKATNNAHLITELANYLEYLNEYKDQDYEIEDLTVAQEEIKDPMQSYEFLASVKVKSKSGLIQNVVSSGRVKFMYYVYAYVPDLTEEEKSYLESNIKAMDTEGKYKAMLENEEILEDKERGGKE